MVSESEGTETVRYSLLPYLILVLYIKGEEELCKSVRWCVAEAGSPLFQNKDRNNLLCKEKCNELKYLPKALLNLV